MASGVSRQIRGAPEHCLLARWLQNRGATLRQTSAQRQPADLAQPFLGPCEHNPSPSQREREESWQLLHGAASLESEFEGAEGTEVAK